MECLGTKGKWQFNKNFEVDSSDRMDFRISTENEVSRIEYEANKLLFSKAPEMLEILNFILMENYTHSEIMPKIEQLIKEATEI